MDLPVEKQLTHRTFCDQVSKIKDVNVARKMLEDLHFKYLSNQADVSRIAKQEFSISNGEN